jgi:hypothetical protein
VTLFFLRGTPNLPTVIPAMDHLNSFLATTTLDEEYLLSIQASVTIGKKLLNKYYDMTDLSEVYRIAMGTFSIFLPYGSYILASFKCYIPATNSNISRTPVGMRIGLRVHVKLSKPSLTVHMRSWISMNQMIFNRNQ